jgi:hypothetical protein
MTTGCACPHCGTGITPKKDEPCRSCQIQAMPEGLAKTLAKAADRVLNGRDHDLELGG